MDVFKIDGGANFIGHILQGGQQGVKVKGNKTLPTTTTK